MKVDERAGTFSESYYRRLYRETKASCSRLAEELDFRRNMPFDAADFSRQYDLSQRSNRKRLMNALPQDILERVADLRVLSLGVCTAEVKAALDAFTKKSIGDTMQTFEDYRLFAESQFADGYPAWMEDFSFFDYTVASARRSGRDYVITLEPFKQVVFKNATVIKKERILAGSRWMYSEVYKTDVGYEIHGLCERKDMLEFIIECEDVNLNN